MQMSPLSSGGSTVTWSASRLVSGPSRVPSPNVKLMPVACQHVKDTALENTKSIALLNTGQAIIFSTGLTYMMLMAAGKVCVLCICIASPLVIWYCLLKNRFVLVA
jgi:hypothetical protein